MRAELVRDAVANLVTQFSSSLDFYRELVQNSIDAGSSGIDVWLEFIPGEGVEGVMAIHVDDSGEGMNEEIIDSQLTRLFASAKDGDLTKIGKFGIGFVSVFAPGPKAVLLHTGRAGEYWEVLFHEDRTFTKTRLTEPVEGTQITLFLAGDRARYAELVESSFITLRRWCQHARSEITFEDRSAPPEESSGSVVINRPLEVEGDCPVRVGEHGTEMVLAFSEDPAYGFYNQGLTLALMHDLGAALGPEARRFRNISFKVDSRYLEHTLSRESVLVDDNLRKAVAALTAAADVALVGRLVDDMEALVAQPRWNAAEVGRYFRYLGFLADQPRESVAPHGNRKLVRTVDGRALSLSELTDSLSEAGFILADDHGSDLSKDLAETMPTVLSPTGAGGDEPGPVHLLAVRHLAAAVRGGHLTGLPAFRLVRVPRDLMVRVETDEAMPAAVHQLLEGVERHLAASSTSFRSIATGRMPERRDDEVLFVVGAEVRPVMALPQEGTYHRGRFERPCAVFNRRHPYFRWALELHATWPQMAFYCLARALLLGVERAVEDGRLMTSVRGST